MSGDFAGSLLDESLDESITAQASDVICHHLKHLAQQFEAPPPYFTVDAPALHLSA